MNEMSSEGASYEEAKKMADGIMARIKCRPVVGIICGSGLGELANMVNDTEIIGYKDIPGFPVSTDSDLVFSCMSKAYTKRLREHADVTAKSIDLHGFRIHEGVVLYVGCSLPRDSFGGQVPQYARR